MGLQPRVRQSVHPARSSVWRRGDERATCTRPATPHDGGDRAEPDAGGAGAPLRDKDAVAERILGVAQDPPGDHELDYAWTHHFGRRFQPLGTIDPVGRAVLRMSRPEERAAFYMVEDTQGTTGWISINAPRELATAMMRSRPNRAG
ncbi:hypothetical protein GCM10023351_32390 [Microbacterium gilvum]|uniref:Uncharacterized protein n=1 Tax=Microbacterium gilvum TaxID=1336204 RepID=A0ABP9ASH8_9MICO